DFELLHGVVVRHIGGAAAGSVIGNAVDGPFIATHVAGGGVIGITNIGLEPEPVIDAAGLDSGTELYQNHGIRSDDRNIHQRAIVHDAARGDGAGVEHRRFGGDRDGLVDGADFEFEIDFDARADLELDARPHYFAKSRSIDGNLIGAGKQKAGFVITGRVGLQMDQRVGV